ncbi:MAG: hypothetical protein JWN63_2753 [Candidatus Acidoferrum typicum]|nr:hypothetical protein [Candidatus Acidoferrum typicum]
MMETITLDGRKFRGISQALTSNQDDYILAHLRLAGSIEVMSDPDGVKRTKEQRAEDLLTRILLSGRTHHILAGCLTEEGKVWNRTEADANAARFAAIIDVSEKQAMRSAIVGFVIDFFGFREAASENSSSQNQQVPATENEAPATSDVKS